MFDQTYTYDELNRLKAAEEKTGATTNWKQTFTFDRYGNRRFDEANTTMPASFTNQALTNPAFDASNNRMAAGQGWNYDAAGNTVGDPEGRTFIYDAENKQVEVRNASSTTVGQYFYDGDGKRVKKFVPSTGETTVFAYDAAGKLIAEYSTIVASTQDAKVAYLTTDHLGSPRINTDANGATASGPRSGSQNVATVVRPWKASREEFWSSRSERQCLCGRLMDVMACSFGRDATSNLFGDVIPIAYAMGYRLRFATRIEEEICGYAPPVWRRSLLGIWER